MPTVTKPSVRPAEKPTEKPVVKRDFSALDFDLTDAPVRASAAEQYPRLADAVRQTRESNKRAIMPPRTAPPLPVAEAKELERLLRRVADGVNLGISVALIEDLPDGKWRQVSGEHTGPVRVRFAGKERKAYDSSKPRLPQWTAKQSKADFDASWAAYVRDVNAWNTTHPSEPLAVKDRPTEPRKPRAKKV